MKRKQIINSFKCTITSRLSIALAQYRNIPPGQVQSLKNQSSFHEKVRTVNVNSVL